MGRRLTADGRLQIGHLDCRQRRLEAFVAHLQTGAVDSLLERVAGENAEGMWHAGLLRGLPDSTGDFVDDHVVVSGVATQQATEADDGIVFLGFSQGAGGGRDFEGARDADKLDIFEEWLSINDYSTFN